MATFNYTSREYSTIKEDLLSRASSMIPEWTDRNASDFMMSLIDLWAYSADVLHFYVDRAATEAFLSTATQRDSVLALANLYDYTPNFRSSAVASVSFTNTGTTNIEIPAGTRLFALIDNERYYFYTSSSYTMASGATALVPCSQGVQYVDQPVSLASGLTTSDGTGGQRFTIRDANVVPSTLVVDVYEGTNGAAVRWQYDQNLANSGSSDSSYSVYVSADGYTQIVFGNGVTGRIPPINAVIKASYTVSDGSLGNVGPMTITRMVNPITNILINGNPTAAFGGSETESITSIKRNLPSVFRTLGRAVSLSDYEDLALSVQGVSKAKAVYNGSGANGGSVTVHVVPYQTDYSTSGSVSATLGVDSILRSDVARQLSAASMIGISAISVPSSVSTDRVRIDISLQVLDNYVQQWVRESVQEAVVALFDFDVVTFGGRLSLGEVYRTIMSVPGVDYADITAFNKNNDTTLTTSVTAQSTRLLQRGIISIAPSGGVTPPVV